ncbi:MAG: M48 family metalloprotease [Rhizobiales bacterium]|nr:M48 family metalloprotease [Hyphomicrobiales bacterium]
MRRYPNAPGLSGERLRRDWRTGAQRLAVLALAVVSIVLESASAQAQRLSFVRDTELEQLLSDYSAPIFRAAGLGGGRVTMRIVKDNSFNAFVLDGRNVFMNTGTLMQSDTPNEVIGVIAHEAGHIAGGHLADIRAKIKRDSTRLMLMQALGIAAMAAGAASGDKDIGEIAGGVGQTILGASGTAVQRGILTYRRVHESAADQAAISYLNATRQSARGMLSTFERFAQQELFSAQLQDPYVRSHPMPQQRIAQLRNLASRSPHFDERDAPSLQLRHDLMRAKLSGYLERPQTVFNRFPESDNSLPAQYARAIASFFGSGIESALPRVERLIAAKPDYPYFHELKGELLLRSGRAAEAVGPLRKALTLAGDGDLIRIRLAQALISMNDRSVVDEAIAMLRKALTSEENSAGYRQLATAYWQSGREGDAYLASAQAHFFEGNLGEAKRFAERAQAQFRQGTPSWIKADDIIKFQR